MPAKHLTDKFLQNVKIPKSKPQVAYMDRLERGLMLMLVVSYGGTKTFRVGVYRDGVSKKKKDGTEYKVRKLETYKLGTYPAMKLAAAKDKAREYWQDPRKFKEQVAVGTFKEIAQNWFKRHVEAKGLRSEYEIRRQLDKYVYPEWGGKKFLEIRRREVNELLDHIADHHGRVQADRVLATVRKIMDWHQSRDDNYASPIVKGMRRSEPSARERIVNDNELRRLWEACAKVNGTYGGLVKVLLLTGQRKDKVATMRWDDLVGDDWTIREEKREKGSGGKLKLPSMALEVIEAQPRIGGNPFVFAGRGGKAFNSYSQRKEELDALLPGMARWVLHDLRRTARSLLSRAGVLPHIAERVLGHAQPTIQQVYDRHQYDTEKGEALQKLADLIAVIINPPQDNVVPLRR
jgi:integrase